MILCNLNIFTVHIKNIGMHTGKRMKTCQQTKQMLVVEQNIQALTHLYQKRPPHAVAIFQRLNSFSAFDTRTLEQDLADLQGFLIQQNHAGFLADLQRTCTVIDLDGLCGVIGRTASSRGMPYLTA